MTLPRRIRKEPKRSKRWRSTAHCNFVRDHHCCVPGCMNKPIEVAHIRTGSDAGMGRKPSDFFTVSLCQDHHSEQHRKGESTFQADHRINLMALADEFAKESPKAFEIREAKREMGWQV